MIKDDQYVLDQLHWWTLSWDDLGRKLQNSRRFVQGT